MTGETLLPFVRSVVAPGATVVTDGWHPYRPLGRLGYTHVRHVQRGSGKQAHELLPACHRVAALLKRWLLGTHQGSIRPDHLDYYLDEFTFRFNRRRSNHRGLLFYRLLQHAAETTPQPYTTLLSDAARRRQAHRSREARKRRATGMVGEPKNVRGAGRSGQAVAGPGWTTKHAGDGSGQ